MADCYDEKGNKVPCDKIKSSWKKSTDISKGTEMKEIYTPFESTKKDPKVYDKLQAEIDSGFAKAKYGFEGSNLNNYIKAKTTDKIYKSPSKNNQQTETLEIIKRGGFIDIGSTPSIRTVEITEDASGIDGGSGKKIEKKTKTSKTSKSYKYQKRSIYSSKGPKVKNKRGLHTCTKKGCVGKGEASIKKQKRKMNKKNKRRG
tara:strand:+ start:5640 stop:6245 length:606 start_codon:yes stop_codon:yes gene_type:complete